MRWYLPIYSYICPSSSPLKPLAQGRSDGPGPMKSLFTDSPYFAVDSSIYLKRSLFLIFLLIFLVLGKKKKKEGKKKIILLYFLFIYSPSMNPSIWSGMYTNSWVDWFVCCALNLIRDKFDYSLRKNLTIKIEYYTLKLVNIFAKHSRYYVWRDQSYSIYTDDRLNRILF